MGLILVKDPKQIKKEGASGISGVQFRGLKIKDPDNEFSGELQEFIGQPFSDALRTKIIDAIVLYYRNEGHPIVDVSTPPQDITSGVLQILVLEGKVGKVRVEGARWFNEKYVSGQIRAQPGDNLDSTALGEDLDWINRNPFRQVDLVYAKGSELGQTDLVLREKDTFPLRFYTGYEDSGTSLTGIDRLLGGLNWGNVLGLDGQLNYQFMTDPRFEYFEAHSVTYVQPLPWRHTLTLLASNADTHGDVPAPFTLGGFSWQLSARYEIPLPSFWTYQHSFTAGFDYKRSNNNLAFGGVGVYGGTVDVVQGSLGYSSSFKDSLGGTTFRGTLTYSPGGMTSLNHNGNFESARAGAAANYTYGKIEINRTTGLPYDFMLVNLLTAQVSDANLLASEQLGFGGYDTIRGYDMRVVNSDAGYILSTELRTPPMSLLNLAHVKSVPDKLQFLGFFDYGGASDKHLLPGEMKTTYLASAGPGLRYSIDPYLSVRADYGWQLLSLANQPNAMRWHVGVVLSY